MEISVIARNKLILLLAFIVYEIFFFSFPVKIKRFIVLVYIHHYPTIMFTYWLYSFLKYFGQCLPYYIWK